MFQKSAQANNKENIKAQDQRAFVRGTCVTKPSHLVAPYTKFWIEIDIYKLYYCNCFQQYKHDDAI